MAIEFKLPELGENIAGGDVTRVLVKVGDHVKEEQAVLEIETGKATEVEHVLIELINKQFLASNNVPTQANVDSNKRN